MIFFPHKYEIKGFYKKFHLKFILRANMKVNNFNKFIDTGNQSH